MKNYDKVDVYNEELLNKLSENYKNILSLLGEDVQREGLEKTPMRVAKAMSYITNGYQIDPVEILKSAYSTKTIKKW